MTGYKTYSQILDEYGNDELYHHVDAWYRVFARIKFVLDLNHYDEYNRIKKNILDYLSNICSLCFIVRRLPVLLLPGCFFFVVYYLTVIRSLTCASHQSGARTRIRLPEVCLWITTEKHIPSIS